MITVSDDKCFALTNSHYSYVFRVSPEGLLEHLHFGAPLSAPREAGQYVQRTERGLTATYEGVKDYDLQDTPLEYPVFGRSDFRYPAFHGRNSDGNSIFDLRYARHEIVNDKPALKGLPSARGGESETLIVTLTDVRFGVSVHLSYTVYALHGVLAKSVRFENHGDADIELQNVASSNLDLPTNDYELLHLHGKWAREFNAARHDVTPGRFVIESARGTSSAAHHPFAAIMERGASETHGRVWANTLVYSGNFAISVERNEYDAVRVISGINPFNFGWTLKPGEAFQAPESLHVFTDGGLSAMSHIWHDFVREKISPPAFKGSPRPTYLNTWESAYFEVNEDKVLALADTAKSIGVDMLVLDDGWFKGRADETSSLGDWTADPTRFPKGIPALAAQVRAKGLKFGLWFEPEMVSPNSDLYRAHPDWALHVPGRTPSLGRNQLTLDLSRTDVVDYISGQLDAILSCGDIDYVKWDMNRNMTELGSAYWPAAQQSEIAHRYILGLYDLLSRLTARYPNVLFENCASGGNRADLGMMSFMVQSWTSDMCDPIGRLPIINGLSYLYPMDVTAAYIGPSPNHQNGRVTSLQTRVLAGALCAAQGVSLSQADIEKDHAQIKGYIARAKATAAQRLGGRFERLSKTDNSYIWQFTTADEKTVCLTYFKILSAPNAPYVRAYLRGLDARATYCVDGETQTYRGDTLMHSGLALPHSSLMQTNPDMRYMDSGDFAAHMFVLRRG